MDLIIRKYKKYNIRYNSFSNKIIIESKIPVKVFVKLKNDLEALNIKVRDIEVTNDSD